MTVNPAETEQFWLNACSAAKLDKQARHYAWTFGDLSLNPGTETVSNDVVRLVLQGKMRGACPPLLDIEKRGLPVPRAGDFWIVTDAKGKPACVVRIEKVEQKAYGDIDESLFASLEAEGEDGYQYLLPAHNWYLKRVFEKWGQEFDNRAPLVLVNFQLVYPLRSAKASRRS